MSNKLIELCNVSKSFNNTTILDNINLILRKGQSIALIGHNGAGKSTLLRILANLTRTTSGSIKYASNLKINYIPERFPKMNITAREYIMHMGLIEGLNKKEIQSKSEYLFKTFFMENMQNTSMKHLSKGTLQKVAVIQALLTKPSVVLLDEPLSGQDIESQNVFIEKMNELKRQGVAIVMSCHEKFLINSMSDYIYEIKDSFLREIQFSEMNFVEYDVLVFDISKANDVILPEVKYPIKGIEIREKHIKVTIISEKSNDFILKMIQNKWQLKEMYNESN